MQRINYYENKYFSEKELQCPTSKDIILAEGFLKLFNKFKREM